MGQDLSTTGTSQPPQVINAYRKNTPFSYVEADQILLRYTSMDRSEQGNTGISVDDCIMMPEFTGCVVAPDLIKYFKDSSTQRIHSRQFMKICAMLCRRTPALKKKQLLFDMYDVDKQKILTHDALFRMYKLFFHSAVSDDHILALVFSALRHPNLSHEGEVSRDEFCEMIPDVEIQERMSVDFAFDPARANIEEGEEGESEDVDTEDQ